MENGYVKLWRKSLTSGIMQSKELWMFWGYCLMKASHKECNLMVGYIPVTLKPGQFVFGRKKASQEIPLSEQEIRTCVHILSRMQNLTIKSTNKFSIITITNWDSYQSENNSVNHQINQPSTSKQPASNQQATTNKNVKNVKNKNIILKNKIIFSSDSTEIRLANFLFKHVLRNNANAKEPNFQSWAKSFNAIIRIDKRDPEQIKDVIRWCQKDDFWFKVILSPENLRKKYDQLYLSMSRTPGCSDESKQAIEEYLRERNGI